VCIKRLQYFQTISFQFSFVSRRHWSVTINVCRIVTDMGRMGPISEEWAQAVKQQKCKWCIGKNKTNGKNISFSLSDLIPRRRAINKHLFDTLDSESPCFKKNSLFHCITREKSLVPINSFRFYSNSIIVLFVSLGYN